ncbi:MAG: RluA family pseudouridine synthase [Eubacteriales bacterium]
MDLVLNEYEFVIEEEYIGQRIDKVLAAVFPNYTRSYLQKIVKDGSVLVNQRTIKVNYQMKVEDCISMTIPDAVLPEIVAEDIPLDILYEDDNLIVVNKPKNMVVHPAPGHYKGTLVNAIMYHCKGNLSGINGVLRPGIVHRIDKDTTGSLLVCKNDFAHQCIAKQLKDHTIKRKYRAIVYGNVKESSGTICAPIARHKNDRKKMAIVTMGGKEAITHYKVLASTPQYSYIECSLETGRTHQIRVHMASIGHPLLGDIIYSKRNSPYTLNGQTLHAYSLGFVHPASHEYIELQAPIPTYFLQLLVKTGLTAQDIGEISSN